MTVHELIEELGKHDPEADVRMPDGETVAKATAIEPMKLTDGSEYPIVMLSAG